MKRGRLPLLGVFGGTFDPIHYGHLRMAEELADQLDLSRVCFIPTGRPWHREAPGANPEQRLAMVRLAVAANPRFVVDDREVRGDTPGYTVETLAALRLELDERQPICLLLGADAFLGLEKWRRWRELFALAHLAVAHRPGFALQEECLAGDLRMETERRLVGDGQALGATAAGRIVACPIAQLDIAATSIRAQIAAGRSARYLLPDAVLDYIRLERLYL